MGARVELGPVEDPVLVAIAADPRPAPRRHRRVRELLADGARLRAQAGLAGERLARPLALGLAPGGAGEPAPRPPPAPPPPPPGGGGRARARPPPGAVPGRGRGGGGGG